jgi:hypothetical protein
VLLYVIFGGGPTVTADGDIIDKGYMLVTKEMSWEAAENYCRKNGRRVSKRWPEMRGLARPFVWRSILIRGLTLAREDHDFWPIL